MSRSGAPAVSSLGDPTGMALPETARWKDLHWERGQRSEKRQGSCFFCPVAILSPSWEPSAEATRSPTRTSS